MRIIVPIELLLGTRLSTSPIAPAQSMKVRSCRPSTGKTEPIPESIGRHPMERRSMATLLASEIGSVCFRAAVLKRLLAIIHDFRRLGVVTVGMVASVL